MGVYSAKQKVQEVEATSLAALALGKDRANRSKGAFLLVEAGPIYG